MKIIAFADLQATVGSERCFHDPTLSLQEWRFTRFLEELNSLSIEHQCVGIWDAGDLTDDRTALPLPAVHRLMESLNMFQRSRWNLKAIGNHEQHHRDSRITIAPMVCNTFQTVDVWKEFDIDGHHILVVSYPESHVELSKKLDAYGPKRDTVLLGHFQVSGASMASGLSLDGVPKSVLADFKLGLLGHVHRPQTVVNNVHYIGSPFQQHFGERDENKRVALVDLDSCEVEWIPLQGYPIYRYVNLEQFKELALQDSEDRFKVVLRNAEEAQEYYAHPNAKRADEIIYQYEEIQTASGPVVHTNGGVWTPSGLLARWMQLNQPAKLGIDIPDDDMLRFGREIAEIQY